MPACFPTHFSTSNLCGTTEIFTSLPSHINTRTQQMDPRAQSYPQLLIDGYITSTFGSQDAEMLYYTLLRRSPGHILASHAPQLFLAEPPPRPDIDPRIPRPPWVIDYVARDVGTVIRQKLWVPRGIQSDFLCPPIFFVHQNGALGLHLPRAVGGDCWSLRGADGRTPLDESASTHAQVRVNVSRLSCHILRSVTNSFNSGVDMLRGTTRSWFEPNRKGGRSKSSNLRSSQSTSPLRCKCSWSRR